MLWLWELTGEGMFKQAARHITDVAAEVVHNPIAWQAQAAVRRYRALTGSDRYDHALHSAPEDQFRPVEELTLLTGPEDPVVTCPLGMRSDKPAWLDSEGRPAPSPLLWALKGIVEDDEAWLARAVDLGRAHFELAQRAYGDVTSHGCGSRSLTAVARGHGRLNGAGVVTEVLNPALRRLGRL